MLASTTPKISASSPQLFPAKPTYNFKQFKNNLFLKKQYQLTNDFYGFNIGKVSHQNIKRMRELLAMGKGALKNLTDKKSEAYFSQINLPTTITPAEQIIFEKLIASFTLKHGTNAAKEIRAAGKMQSVRSLEASGKLDADRHTPSKSGIDSSIYFVLGIGNHKIPNFVANSSHTISAKLSQLEQDDRLAIERLWVSGHLSEYLNERENKIKLGNVILTVKHFKNLTKEYSFIYPSGETLTWKINYQDEVFAGGEVSPGIALQFIFMLRLLGGCQNPLVAKLYELANLSTPAFTNLLQKVFSAMLRGWVYPEAKVIEELSVNQNAVSIKKKEKSFLDIHQFRIVEEAVHDGDLLLLKALIKKGYSCRNGRENLLVVAIKNIKDVDTRLAIMRELIAEGVKPEDKDWSNESALHTAVKEGTAEDLDFLLSQNYRDPTEPLIQTLANPNTTCEREHLDLVDTACAIDFSGEKLAVLKKHEADFKTNGFAYLNSAIEAKQDYSSCPNYLALQYLREAGVSPDKSNCFNHTPLMNACKLGEKNIVKFLIEFLHADVNAQLNYHYYSLFTGKAFTDDPSDGMTALHFAAEQGDIELVKYLLKKGADPSILSTAGKTALDCVPIREFKKELYNVILQAQKNSTVANSNKEVNVLKPENKKNGAAHKVAVILLGQRASGKPYVVLGKRRPSLFSSHHYYCFPGGSANKKDLSLEDAALREFFEETSVDVKKIPNAKITHLGQFTGFDAIDHQSTSFFLVDVGNYPISVQACDDLIDAKKVSLEQLQFNKTNTTEEILDYVNQGQTTPLLGSNALIVNACFLNQQNTLSEKEKIKIREQLLIEAQGYQMLLDAIENADEINQDQSGIVPDSKAWNRITYLLNKGAHLAPKTYYQTNLAMAMMQANSSAGLSLLKQFKVDLNDSSEFELNGNRNYGSSLHYAIAANRLDFVQLLTTLEPSLLTGRDSSLLLVEAAKNGNEAILSYLIDQGLNPNQSFEYEGKVGSLIVYPIMGAAVKNDQYRLLAKLVKDKRIYVNRERSPKERNTTLMTAISHKKQSAIYPLLASSKIDLTVKNKPQNSREKPQTALAMALQNGWDTIAELIQFHLDYLDMNDYLQKNCLPEMDAFLFAQDEQQKPAIHFISSDKNKLKQLKTIVGNDACIHANAEGNQFYLRLGLKRLTRLLKNSDRANYLLQHTHDSIFWSVRSNDYRDLQRGLVSNTLNKLNVEWLDANEQFFNLENKEYYAQLIKENISVKELEFNLSYPNKNALEWFALTTSGHDKVECVSLSAQSGLNDFQAEDVAVWEKILDAVISLKKLETINCNALSFSCLEALLERFSKQNMDFFPKINISGFYKFEQYENLIQICNKMGIKNKINLLDAHEEQQALLDACIIENQKNFYVEHDNDFRIEMAERDVLKDKTLDLRMNQPFSQPQKNQIINSLGLLHAEPKELHLSTDFYAADPVFIHNFIKNNRSLTSLYLFADAKQPCFVDLLDVLKTANLSLKHFKLNFNELDTNAINSLAEVIRNHPLEMLDLSYDKFISSDEVCINNLADAIASAPQLVTLDLHAIKFAAERLHNAFFSRLKKSNSLLSIDIGFNTAEGFVDELNSMRKNNCIAFLSKKDNEIENKPIKRRNTMKDSINLLSHQQNALEILYACLNFHTDYEIPLKLLPQYSEYDLNLLVEHGFIKFDHDKDALTILVSKENKMNLLDELTQELKTPRASALANMIQKINNALNAQRDDTKNFIASMRVIPHAETLIQMQESHEPALMVRFMFNLASYYSRNSELIKAKNLFEKTLEAHKAANLDQKMLADILQTYGTNFIRLQNCYKGSEILKQALDLRQSLYSPTEFESPRGYNPIHHTAISYGSSIAYNLDMPVAERMQKALPIVINAVAAFEEEFKRNRSQYLAFQIAESKAIIGYLYRLNKQFDLAEQYFTETQKLYLDKELFKEGHIDIARMFNNLGLMALEKDKDLVKAEKYFLEAIDQVKNLPPNNHHLCDTYMQLAKIYHTNKQYVYAKSYINKAKDLIHAVYGEHNAVAESAKLIEDAINVSFKAFKSRRFFVPAKKAETQNSPPDESELFLENMNRNSM